MPFSHARLLSRRRLMQISGAAAGAGILGSANSLWRVQPIKVGILHSLSGTMAISETTLKDVILMLIAEQNEKGGVLGRPLEAVVVDPPPIGSCSPKKRANSSPKTRCPWCSAAGRQCSRKSVLPVFKELNNLLFFPVDM